MSGHAESSPISVMLDHFVEAAICCYCRHANHCLLDPLNHVTLLSPNLNCRQRPCFVVTKCFFFQMYSPDFRRPHFKLSLFSHSFSLSLSPLLLYIPRATTRSLLRVHFGRRNKKTSCSLRPLPRQVYATTNSDLMSALTSGFHTASSKSKSRLPSLDTLLLLLVRLDLRFGSHWYGALASLRAFLRILFCCISSCRRSTLQRVARFSVCRSRSPAMKKAVRDVSHRVCK